MADNNKLFADFQSVFTKYVLPIGVSTATVGIFFFLRKLGILYQLFHKVHILHIQVQHCFLHGQLMAKTKLPKSSFVFALIRIYYIYALRAVCHSWLSSVRVVTRKEKREVRCKDKTSRKVSRIRKIQSSYIGCTMVLGCQFARLGT